MSRTALELPIAEETREREAELAAARRARRLRELAGISEDEARTLLERWLERWPAMREVTT